MQGLRDCYVCDEEFDANLDGWGGANRPFRNTGNAGGGLFTGIEFCDDCWDTEVDNCWEDESGDQVWQPDGIDGGCFLNCALGIRRREAGVDLKTGEVCNAILLASLN